ncbi:MAG: hypothetical protein ACLQVI_00180 [Polyangiaceae bacterium]
MARALLGFGLISVLACSSQQTSPSVLQSSDLVAVSKSFNPDEIVDLASFTDATGIAETDIQSFLEATPYGQPSFLSTYSSNGIRADDAIMQAAARYTLNPLVFLVAAEEAQGLVGTEAYPGTPASVEYVFNCGCATAQASCDPLQAGFDVQVECLANQLRQSLDAVAAGGRTAGGWGPGTAQTTLDGVRVTPADDSTAAIYQYLPTVAEGAPGGTWLFWNLWKKYATALNYAGAGGVVTPTASIGDGCTVSGDCGYPGGVCATNYPGGLCTAPCTSQCPTDASGGAAFCADFQQQGGYCLPICNPSASACRAGYTCEKVAQYGDATVGQYVCSP